MKKDSEGLVKSGSKILEVEDGSVRLAATAEGGEYLSNGDAAHSASSSGGEEAEEEDGRPLGTLHHGKRQTSGSKLVYFPL